MNRHIERIIYAVALASGMLSLFFKMNTVISILLALFIILYLVLGWMMLNPERSRKFDVLYFIVGYFFSTALLSLLFQTRDYPLKDILIYGSIVILILSFILVVFIDRARKRPVTENVVKIVLLLGVVVGAILL